jgi:hypothetical protein
MTQLSGYPRLVVPPKCVLLTCGIDVRKSGLHYVVLGVEQDFTGHVILHDFHATHGTTYGIDDGVDIAIERALLDLHEQLKLQEWMKENGEILDLSLSLADSGYRQQAVYSAAAKIGDKFYPSRGHGKSEGCTQTNFSEQQQRTPDRKPFDGAFLTREGKIWLCHVDADRWKRFVHDRFLTAPGRPGCFDMFGVERSDGGRQTPDERAHQTFANQICNESEVDQVVKGVLRRRFKQKGQNHFLDALALACAAASIRGIRLPLSSAAKPAKVLPKHTAATVGAGGAVTTTRKKYFQPADLVRAAAKGAWR